MSDVYLHITSGNGPVECRIAVRRLVARMREDAAVDDLAFSSCDGPCPDENGPKSAVVTVSGEDAEAFAKKYRGTVKFVFKSPVRPGHERQNWFVGVERIEPRSGTESRIATKDVRFETLRAGGPGGQHQNVTDSAVRAVHIPSGLTVLCRDERSQHRNKAVALARLQALLDLAAQEKVEQGKRDLFAANKSLERGNAVMTIKIVPRDRKQMV